MKTLPYLACLLFATCSVPLGENGKYGRLVGGYEPPTETIFGLPYDGKMVLSPTR